MKDLRIILYILGACIAISLTSCGSKKDSFNQDVTKFNHELYELKKTIEYSSWPYTSKNPEKVNEFIESSTAQYYLILDEMLMRYKKPEQITEINRLRLRLEVLLTKHEYREPETYSTNDSSANYDIDVDTE